MLEGHIHEWVNLLIRWIHFIVGVAWIGASFYFNWLENNLNRKSGGDGGVAGDLWAIHGGGFYHLKKYKTGPGKLPDALHWFKWEAYTTWLSGITLLAVVYYFNARLYLIDPAVKDLAPSEAIIIAVVAVIGSWFVYDFLCRSPVSKKPVLLAVSIAAYLAILAFFLSTVFSGRGAYIHLGAAIGTIMVGNVFFVIIPAQKEMVSALSSQRSVDPNAGAGGLLRSTHNNYFTLPVLFIMISSHFPSTFGHAWSWLVLVLLSAIGVTVRTYFNFRKVKRSLWWLLPLSFVAMAGLMWLTQPAAVRLEQGAVSTQQVETLIHSKCSVCHSDSPTQPGFSAPPAGLALDTLAQIESSSQQIYQAAVVTKTMPIGNLTGMTDDERSILAAWFVSRQENSAVQNQ